MLTPVQRWTLDNLADSDFFPEDRGALDRLAQRWRQHVASGRFRISVPASTPLGADVPPANFWTTQYPFQDLPAVDPALVAELQQAGLVLFKGDLK